MRTRKFRALALIAMGYSFQVLGCQSDNVNVFLAESLRDAALGASAIVIGSALDNALGLTDLE